MTGQLDRQAGRVEWEGGRVSVAGVEEGVITVDHPYPPSWGFGSVAFRFER